MSSLATRRSYLHHCTRGTRLFAPPRTCMSRRCQSHTIQHRAVSSRQSGSCCPPHSLCQLQLLLPLLGLSLEVQTCKWQREGSPRCCVGAPKWRRLGLAATASPKASCHHAHPGAVVLHTPGAREPVPRLVASAAYSSNSRQVTRAHSARGGRRARPHLTPIINVSPPFACVCRAVSSGGKRVVSEKKAASSGNCECSTQSR